MKNKIAWDLKHLPITTNTQFFFKWSDNSNLYMCHVQINPTKITGAIPCMCSVQMNIGTHVRLILDCGTHSVYPTEPYEFHVILPTSGRVAIFAPLLLLSIFYNWRSLPLRNTWFKLLFIFVIFFFFLILFVFNLSSKTLIWMERDVCQIKIT